MDIQNLSEREEKLIMLAKKIQQSGLQMPDIRERDWSKIDCKASRLLNLLIEAENLLIDLDEFQVDNDQCYPEIEDMMLQIGVLREKYTDFVDSNLEVLKIKD